MANPVLTEAWKQCPYRTVISLGRGPLAHVFAAIGGAPESMRPDELASIVAALKSGKSVLVMGTRADLRDHAKAEIMLAVSAVAGRG